MPTNIFEHPEQTNKVQCRCSKHNIWHSANTELRQFNSIFVHIFLASCKNCFLRKRNKTLRVCDMKCFVNIWLIFTWGRTEACQFKTVKVSCGNLKKKTRLHLSRWQVFTAGTARTQNTTETVTSDLNFNTISLKDSNSSSIFSADVNKLFQVQFWGGDPFLYIFFPTRTNKDEIKSSFVSKKEPTAATILWFVFKWNPDTFSRGWAQTWSWCPAALSCRSPTSVERKHKESNSFCGDEEFSRTTWTHSLSPAAFLLPSAGRLSLPIQRRLCDFTLRFYGRLGQLELDLFRSVWRRLSANVPCWIWILSDGWWIRFCSARAW